MPPAWTMRSTPDERHSSWIASVSRTSVTMQGKGALSAATTSIPTTRSPASVSRWPSAEPKKPATPVIRIVPAMSVNDVTAVDYEVMALNVARARGGEKANDFGDLVGPAVAAARKVLQLVRQIVGILARPLNIVFCHRRAGAHRIDHNICGRELEGHRHRQMNQGCFRESVEREILLGDTAHLTRNVDDAPAAVLFHDWRDFLAHQKRRAQIDGDDLIELLRGELAEWPPHADGGVIHQNVDPAERCHRSAHDAGRRAFLQKVEAVVPHHGCGGLLAALPHDILEHVVAIICGEEDTGAFGAQLPGDLRANTARTARDQCHLAVQRHRCLP